MSDYSVKSVTLERVQIGMAGAISRHLLEGRVEFLSDEFFPGQVRYMLRGFLWGRKVENHEIRYPADWLEAAKERFLPAWALRRWPVKHRTFRINLKAIYPSLRYEVPNHQPRLVLFQNSDILGGFDEGDHECL